ncbi:MAG: T9SS type A sorting domain-containing protein, partial [Bacteroidota bacterium]
GPVSSTAAATPAKPNLRLSPNPVIDQITLEFDKAPIKSGELQYQIMDSHGQEWKNGKEFKSSEVIGLEDMAPGLYFLHWKNGADEGVLRFIKL